MNSGQLLNRTLANRLVCESQQIAIGPTGPPGPVTALPGVLKAFTIYLDYSGGTSISRVYIPPGLFSTNPTLAAGGVFTANVGTDLVFVGTSTVKMNGTTYAFACSIAGSGYVAAREWNPIPGGRIAPAFVSYSVKTNNAIEIKGLALGNINGANYAVRPTTGALTGFLATITIFYV
jgi:hypothetical protein